MDNPLVKIVLSIVGVVFIIVLVANMMKIYADKTKRGEFITEALIASVVAIFVFMPDVALSIIKAIATLVAQGIKALPGMG